MSVQEPKSVQFSILIFMFVCVIVNKHGCGLTLLVFGLHLYSVILYKSQKVKEHLSWWTIGKWVGVLCPVKHCGHLKASLGRHCESVLQSVS